MEAVDFKQNIITLVDNYIRDMHDLIDRTSSVGDNLKGFFGTGEKKNTHLHEEVFYAVEEEAKAANAYLTEHPDPAYAKELVLTILYMDRPCEVRSETVLIGLVAIEGQAIYVVDHMSPEDAAEVADAYMRKVTKRMMLPKQREVYDRMVARATGKPAKRGLFGRRK